MNRIRHRLFHPTTLCAALDIVSTQLWVIRIPLRIFKVTFQIIFRSLSQIHRIIPVVLLGVFLPDLNLNLIYDVFSQIQAILIRIRFRITWVAIQVTGILQTTLLRILPRPLPLIFRTFS
eukprot:GHVO01034915.1.p1 GENE.GHVO01034915.1~~GHVO01034915.1.p1  ORF type:complete len:120 (-),score=0.72 GHVO01034915.1:43-402(-)